MAVVFPVRVVSASVDRLSHRYPLRLLLLAIHPVLDGAFSTKRRLDKVHAILVQKRNDRADDIHELYDVRPGGDAPLLDLLHLEGTVPEQLGTTEEVHSCSCVISEDKLNNSPNNELSFVKQCKAIHLSYSRRGNQR